MSISYQSAVQIKEKKWLSSAVYSATAVLLEIMNRYGIKYSRKEVESIHVNYERVIDQISSLKKYSDKMLEQFLFDMLTDGMDQESRKKTGSERTPDEIADYMLNLICYGGTDTVDKSIVDPSCGTGVFIAKITERFADALKATGRSEEIKTLLLKEKVIRGYDTRQDNVYITKIVLISVLIYRGLIRNIEDILELIQELPIYCKDFLKTNEKTDFIVGNPPYIRLQNLSESYRDFVKNNFVSATGRFDIYTCFIEKADKSLKVDGKLCLITSNKYLTANYGVGIRRFLSENGHVRKVIDLCDTKFFGAAVLPAIIVCENTKKSNSDIQYKEIRCFSSADPKHCEDGTGVFKYIETLPENYGKTAKYGLKEGGMFEISQSEIKLPLEGKTWNFSSNEENDIKEKLERKKECLLGDIMDICVGIKTTADKIFVKPMTKKFVIEKQFEDAVVYPIIQSFNVEKWEITWGNSPEDRYVLYPHREKKGGMEAVPLEEIPHAAEYLKENSRVLKKRSYLLQSKSRQWYECWVPQKLSKFQQPKIVTCDIVSHNSFAYDDTGKLCQGNTFFLTKKHTEFSEKYRTLPEKKYYLFILGMLNSKVMEYYQKQISGCLYSKKYRYTTSNLKRWPIPRIAENTALEISFLVDAIIAGKEKRETAEEKIDNIMYAQFELTSREIQKIEEFISDRR